MRRAPAAPGPGCVPTWRIAFGETRPPRPSWPPATTKDGVTPLFRVPGGPHRNRHSEKQEPQ
jgi:hypothetical protein